MLVSPAPFFSLEGTKSNPFESSAHSVHRMGKPGKRSPVKNEWSWVREGGGGKKDEAEKFDLLWFVICFVPFRLVMTWS